MRRLAWLLVLPACKFGHASPVQVDAQLTCLDSSVSCVGDVLRVCAEGAEPELTACSWGCLDGAPSHCAQLVPSGGAVMPGDLVPDPELTAAVLSSALDTETGAIKDVRPAGTGVINGIGFAVVNNVAVFRFASVGVVGPITITGKNALALVANDVITIGGALDMRGPCTTLTPGPGGFAGGEPGVSGHGPGGGDTGIDNTKGGGGGGYGALGGAGGAAQGAGPRGGAPYGDAAITMLAGGSGGGGGGASTSGGFGGGGGGALQLASNSGIFVGADINAGGCGGKGPGAAGGGGGGGGAGGTILIEAPMVTLGAAIAANGGGGGAGDSQGEDGAPGDTTISPAPGGKDRVGTGDGGNGGAFLSGAGSPGLTANHPGGGGGSVGRIRIDTRDGNVVTNANASPAPAIGIATVR